VAVVVGVLVRRSMCSIGKDALLEEGANKVTAAAILL